DAELLGRDEPAVGKDERALDGVLQFADVARPSMREEHLAGSAAESELTLAGPGSELTHEVLSEQHDVGPALAQRRQMHAEDREAVIKVFAEPSLRDRLLEVAIRRRDQACVGLEQRRSPHALVLPLLQHAQQLRLHHRGQLADLVEEQRAPLGELEAATLEPVSARERPPLVSE